MVREQLDPSIVGWKPLDPDTEPQQLTYVSVLFVTCVLLIALFLERNK